MKLVVDYFMKNDLCYKGGRPETAENRLVSDIQGRNIFC